MAESGHFAILSHRLAQAVNPFDSTFPVLTNMASGGKIFPMISHDSHPDFGHLIILVMGAVLEVVCVSLPGYIIARQGMFDAENQKFVANLNVQLFTPCLIFTKLASQLTADKLADLAVIPVIFLIQTFVSFISSWTISKMFRFHKRAQNFVIAMAVFGNSNSLPISLVISLSKTLKGLHWDKVPGDNDDEVAARGILYLLIFQQLGQLLRWSWGYNVLLKPAEKYVEESAAEEGRYRDEPEEQDADRLLEADSENSVSPSMEGSTASKDFSSGTATPANKQQYVDSESDDADSLRQHPDILPTPANGNVVGNGPGNFAGHEEGNGDATSMNGFKKQRAGLKAWRSTKAKQFRGAVSRSNQRVAKFFAAGFHKLPRPLQRFLKATAHYFSAFFLGLWSFMNPPLWAMLVAIIVASIPQLQALFFDRGFIHNSVTRAVAQSGGVAVPLILVVLGANLARNTLPKDQLEAEDPKLERNLLIASLLSRMLFPTLIMAPILALFAKYIPVSILDDPIFVIVCFLLTGAPTALQLAQICQINNVYMGAMSRILFQSYVIWILPSTLVLVVLALEVVEWAA